MVKKKALVAPRKGLPNIAERSVQNRLSALESHVMSLKSPAPAVPNAVVSPANPSLIAMAPDSDSRSLVFSLGAGAPTEVRVTLDHSEVVLFNNWSTPSLPRANGTWISVLVEMIGSPGDTATIGITNAMPASLESKIPPGQTHWSDPRLIVAKW